MSHVESTINDYLNALAEVHGQDHANNIQVRHTGGSDVIIMDTEKRKKIVGIGTLRLMSEHLRNSSQRLKAA